MTFNFSLKGQQLINFFGLSISNSLFWSLFLSISLMIFFYFFSKKLKAVPTKIQSIIELIFEFMLSLSHATMGNKKNGKKVFPLFFTFFIFILIANLFTNIPGQAAFSLQKTHVPVFRAVFADYSMALSLTLIIVILCQVVSINVNGLKSYVEKFFTFKNPLACFLGLLNLIGELSKLISLSFRLFGNILAAEILSTISLILMPFFLPVPFALLGLIGSIIQAFIFSLLSLIFISQASTMENNESEII